MDLQCISAGAGLTEGEDHEDIPRKAKRPQAKDDCICGINLDKTRLSVSHLLFHDFTLQYPAYAVKNCFYL